MRAVQREAVGPGSFRRQPLAGLVSGCFSLAVSVASSGVLAQTSTPADPPPTDATATTSPAAAGPQGSRETLEGVTVTARRRPEALVDVPLAITVITSKQLEQLNIKSTNELANYVPGLEFNDFTAGNGRNDRGSTRALVFRGLAVSTVGSFAGSLFLNGAGVLGNEIPAARMDIGQVEILRGPQSVYFGRATMTGAVSYRTKAIPDRWQGEVEVEVGQRDTNNFAASVAGPLIPNLLGARFTALSEKADGYVINDYDNGATRLGARERKSFSNTLELSPTSNLSFKSYFNIFNDDDGPSATAFVPATLDNCKLGTTQTTFCGEIPGRQNSINYINTRLPTAFANVLFNSPLIQGANFDKKVGQQRKANNADLVSNWDINDYLHFQAITGYHTNITTATADGIGQPIQPQFPYSNYFYTFTQKFTDFSQEFRLSSSPDERLSWTLGANYSKTKIYVHAIVGFQSNSTGALSFPTQNLGLQAARTTGVFGGAYFKVTPQLTVSAEARHQSDDREAVSTNLVTGIVASDLSKDFKSWSPRVSADYDLGDHRKVYLSYADGNRPGGFNTGVLAQANNPAALAQIAALLGNSSAAYDEERLRIVELGLKGELADHRGYFDINTYVGKLNNQQITNGALIPLLGFSVTTTSNAGESKIHGIEAQAGYNFTRDLSVSGTFAWNYTKRTSYLNNAGLLAYGTTDFSGKKFAQVPEYSASLIATYTHPLPEQFNPFGAPVNFFSNIGAFYRGKEYMDSFNAAYIKGRAQVDVHAGVQNPRYAIEAYVKNLLNDQNYTGGGVSPDFGSSNTYNAFFGGWAPPRQFGVRLSARF